MICATLSASSSTAKCVANAAAISISRIVQRVANTTKLAQPTCEPFLRNTVPFSRTRSAASTSTGADCLATPRDSTVAFALAAMMSRRKVAMSTVFASS